MLLGQRTQSSRTEARGALAEPKSTAYFFEQALDLGAQSATFELGKRLLDAEDDYFDQARGLELLEEATELGQWRAEVELGLHSLRGVLVEQDYQRAGELIQAGYARSDDSREHQLPLAELFCSAPEPVQNLERCTLELKRRGTDNRSVQSDFLETVGRIYENLDSQSEAIVPIRDYLIEYLNLSEERTTLDGVEAGVGNYEFDRQYGRNGRFEPMSKPETFSLSENLGRTMGLRVKADTPFSMSEEAKTALVLIWKYPDLNGTQRSTTRLVYGRDRWFDYTRRLEQEQALGDYQIEVRNLYNEPLYTYSYSITE
jgi:hypothetical protein